MATRLWEWGAPQFPFRKRGFVTSRIQIGNFPCRPVSGKKNRPQTLKKWLGKRQYALSLWTYQCRLQVVQFLRGVLWIGRKSGARGRHSGVPRGPLRAEASGPQTLFRRSLILLVGKVRSRKVELCIFENGFSKSICIIFWNSCIFFSGRLYYLVLEAFDPSSFQNVQNFAYSLMRKNALLAEYLNSRFEKARSEFWPINRKNLP